MQQSNQSSPGTVEANQATPGTATPNQTPGTAPEAQKPESQLKSLYDLLKGDDEQKPEDGDKPADGATGKAGGDAKKAKPQKFNDLAEMLGVELSDLYKLEVSASEDGSPVTIEMLKDAHAKQVEFTVRELQWAEERERQQSELMRAQAELQELVAALPKAAIKPEILQAVREKHEAAVARERQRTLEVIPEWRDAKTREEDIAKMVEFYQENYALPANYLQSVFDHRSMKVLRDFWSLKQRVRAAFAQLESAKKPGPATKPKPNGAAPKPRGEGRSNKPVERGSRLMALLEG